MSDARTGRADGAPPDRQQATPPGPAPHALPAQRVQGARHVQHIRAEGGFAYGAVGADIHVFGDGTPVYLLLRHRRPAGPDPAWLRSQPSRLLDARAEVVDFTGRDTEMAELLAWRDAEPRFAVRWLHGEGGQGKTRLAGRLAEESERAGWVVAEAVHGTDTHPPADGSQDLRLDGSAGVLVLVDYADRWPLSDLSWLFHNMMLRQPVPARVLLIGRSAGQWPALRGKLDRLRESIHTSDQLLRPLADDGQLRGAMFDAARDCFVRHYPELGAPAPIRPPRDLRHADFGLTLALHMAALVAVDAAACGRTPPTDMIGLTTYLLDRERENWSQLQENSGRGLDYGTPDEVMARTVFTAILSGPVARTRAVTVLERVMPGVPVDRALADHAVCYPPSDRGTALEPLLPDRLAEDFLALLLPGHPVTGFPTDAWATTVPARLLTDDRTAFCAPRAVAFLAAAADRWPHVGGTVLYPVLRDRPDLALRAGSAALSGLSAIGADSADGAHGRPIDPELLMVLERVEPLLPEGEHIDLDAGALAVVERLTAHRLDGRTDPAERAGLYGTLGRRRTNAGKWGPALAAAEEAARLNRWQAGNDPRHRARLADSLTELGNALARHGRWSEALSQSQGATALLRELAEHDPGHRPALARSLTDLGGRFADCGRAREALDVAEEATALRRRLAAEDPERQSAQLARALSGLGALRLRQGHRDEAVEAAEEAVAVLRGLAAVRPGDHLGDLARALGSLGRVRLEAGRRERAVEAAQEAVGLFRRLAEANPAVHRPHLVTSLVHLSATLPRRTEHGDRTSGPALTAAEEAVVLARELAEVDPAIHRRGLGRALEAHGDRLAELGRRDEAVTVLREAADLYQALGSGGSTAPWELTGLLGRLAALYGESGAPGDKAHMLLNLSALPFGAPEERVEVARQAVELYAGTDERAAEAAALLNLGTALARARRYEEAVSVGRRALGTSRELGFREFEAVSLSNLADHLRRAGRYGEAVEAADAACALDEELGREHGHPFYTRGEALLQLGRNEEAVVALERAADLYERTGRREYDDSGDPLEEVDARHSLGTALSRSGRLAEATTALRRAVALYEAAGEPRRARQASLTLCANLVGSGQLDQALPLAERLLARCRAAGDREQEAVALSQYGAVLLEAGRVDEALPLCREAAAALNGPTRPDDPRHPAAAWHNLGRALERSGRPSEAVAPWREAARMWAELGDRRYERDACYGLGVACFALHDNAEAVDAFERAVRLSRRTADRSSEAGALLGLTGALVDAEEFAEAVDAGRLAVELLRELGQHGSEGLALGQLHDALTRLGRPDEATAALEQAAAAHRADRDARGEAAALVRLSNSRIRAGRPDEAISGARRAVDLYAAAGDRLGEGSALHSLGTALSDGRRFEEAAAVNGRCADLMRDLGELWREGSALLNQCSALQETQRFDAVADVADRAAAVHRTIGDRPGEVKALILLAMASRETGRAEERLTAAGRATTVPLELGDPLRAMAWFEFGAALHQAGQQERAAGAFTEAAASYRASGNPRSAATAWLNAGEMHLRIEQWPRAVDPCRQAAALFAAPPADHGNELTAQVSLGKALLGAGHYVESTPVWRRAVDLARALGARETEGTALFMLGAVLVDLGELQEGITVSREAAALLQACGLRSQAEGAIRNMRVGLGKLRSG
ncbi:tetratricopeptide repeat protein [Kitasatospora sp. NPDC086009]|uniref:tetratricopeptide repeat protein n=1 Tax=unclassified Kitasatospora TaxID=2633591 RepID=UPI0037C615C4